MWASQAWWIHRYLIHICRILIFMLFHYATWQPSARTAELNGWDWHLCWQESCIHMSSIGRGHPLRFWPYLRQKAVWNITVQSETNYQANFKVQSLFKQNYEKIQFLVLENWMDAYNPFFKISIPVLSVSEIFQTST